MKNLLSVAMEQAGRWQPVLRGLHADALDCLQTSLALVADAAYGSGSHLALGSRLQWDLSERNGGGLAHRQLEDRLSQASETLGVRVSAHWSSAAGPEVRRLLADARQVCIVADAYDLPWVPYVGRRHMEHSFVLEWAGSHYQVIDAYHSRTPWGAARPGVWRIAADDVDRALRRGAEALVLSPATVAPCVSEARAIAENAAGASSAPAEIERFVVGLETEFGRTCLSERLVLDVWLLARERLLYARWLEGRAGEDVAAVDASARADEWTRLATHAYIVFQRGRKGLADTASVVDRLGDLLHADAASALRMAPHRLGAFPVSDSTIRRGGAADETRSIVVTALREVLRLDPEMTIADEMPLSTLPGFDSFRLVDVLDRVEARLGMPPSAQIDATDLRDVGTLCRLFGGGGELPVRVEG